MKKSFMILVLAILLQSCFSQRPEVTPNVSTAANTQQMYPDHTVLRPEEVPESVKKAWEKEHSSIKGEEWYKTNDGYIVYYPYKKLQSRISFDETGKVLMTSREVEGEDVPLPIRDYMKLKYPGIQYGKTFLDSPVEGDKRYSVQIEARWERFDIQGANLGDSRKINIEENK